MRFLFIGVLLFSINLKSQTFVIQRGQDVFAFDDINIAIDSLQPDDHLYIPGGTHDVDFRNTCGRSIPENTHIVGAGHYPEFTKITGRTVLNSINRGTGCGYGYIYLGENSSISGVDLMMGNFSSGLSSTISHCRFSGLRINSGSVNLYANVFGGISASTLTHQYSLKGIIQKNIIFSGIGNRNLNFNQYKAEYGLTIDSNIFLNIREGEKFIRVDEPIIENNIFLTEESLSSIGFKDARLKNNAWGSPLPSNWDESTNIFGIDVNSTFLNYTKGEDFSYDHDFHIAQGSPLNNADSRGEDIGIYKGNHASENKLPNNPYFIEEDIYPETDNNGKLKVRIRTKSN